MSRRVSVREEDPGYERYVALTAGRNRIEVTLNGEALSDVVTADPDAGYVLRHLIDENGKYVLNETRDEICTEELHGEVRLFVNGREV